MEGIKPPLEPTLFSSCTTGFRNLREGVCRRTDQAAGTGCGRRFVPLSPSSFVGAPTTPRETGGIRVKGTNGGSSVGLIVGLSSRISTKQSKVGSGSTEPYASSHPTGGTPIRWGATASYRSTFASRASLAGVRGSHSTPDGGPTGLAKRTPPGPIGSAAWPGAGSDLVAYLNESIGGVKPSGLIKDDGAASSPGPPVLRGSLAHFLP